jgi:hypothetical protein
MLQAKGGTPPVEGRAALYAVPTVPLGNGLTGMVRTPTTVRVNVCCAESAPPGAVDESVTLTVKVDVLPVVGVPKSTPALFKVIPAGSVPLSKLQFRGCTPPVATRSVW